MTRSAALPGSRLPTVAPHCGPSAVHTIVAPIVAVSLLAAFTFVDYHLIARLAYPMYAAVLLMLVAVFVVGPGGVVLEYVEHKRSFALV